MSYIVGGGIRFQSTGIVVEGCTVFGGPGAFPIEFRRTELPNIGELRVRYSEKPLHERFADFAARLRAAQQRHGRAS